LRSIFDVVALWSTRLTEDSSKSDIKIKTTLRELIIYVVFLIILLISNFYRYAILYHIISYHYHIISFFNFVNPFSALVL